MFSEKLVGRIKTFLKSQTGDYELWHEDADCEACDLLNEVLKETTGEEV